MATFDPAFATLLRDYDLDRLDRHDGAIYAVSDDWRLRYFNEGWSRFALANGGEPRLSQAYPLGAPIFDAFAPSLLREFFEFHYLQCLRDGRMWGHDYECSSASTYRRFRMLVYPLERRGVMVVNAMMVERPHARHETPAHLASYRDAAGLVHQCAHCRRTRSELNHENWDWVPAWVEHMPPRCSHGLCPTCLVFYYLAKP